MQTHNVRMYTNPAWDGALRAIHRVGPRDQGFQAERAVERLYDLGRWRSGKRFGDFQTRYLPGKSPELICVRPDNEEIVAARGHITGASFEQMWTAGLHRYVPGIVNDAMNDLIASRICGLGPLWFDRLSEAEQRGLLRELRGTLESPVAYQRSEVAEVLLSRIDDRNLTEISTSPFVNAYTYKPDTTEYSLPSVKPLDQLSDPLLMGIAFNILYMPYSQSYARNYSVHKDYYEAKLTEIARIIRQRWAGTHIEQMPSSIITLVTEMDRTNNEEEKQRMQRFFIACFGKLPE